MQSKGDIRLRQQFGRQIRSLRLARGLTQFDLAARAKISLQYLQNLESKKPKNPSLETINGLAKALGSPLWKLLKFED